MSESAAEKPNDALWSRLRVIEGQELSARAHAYAALHDELSKRLESPPTEQR